MSAYRKTVVGVLYQGDEILLVKKKHWPTWLDFPQGGVDQGETLSQALLRELREELGTDEFGRPVPTHIAVTRPFSGATLRHYPNKGFIGKEQIYFVVPFFGEKDKIKLGDDLTEYHWHHRAEIPGNVYDGEVARLVVQFMRDIKIFHCVPAGR